MTVPRAEAGDRFHWVEEEGNKARILLLPLSPERSSPLTGSLLSLSHHRALLPSSFSSYCVQRLFIF